MASLPPDNKDLDTEFKHEYYDKHWSEYAVRYRDRVSTFTVKGCEKLVELANDLLPLSPDSSYILDLGTGPGRLAADVAAKYPGVKVLATDHSPSMLRLVDEQNLKNVQTRLVDMRKPFTGDDKQSDKPGSGEAGVKVSSIEEGEFSHVLSSFVIQFLPRPDEVLGNMFRAARKGGVVGIANWGTKVVPIQSWGRACKHIMPEYSVPKAHDPSAWYSCEEIEAAMERQGCKKEDIKSGQTVAKFSGLNAKQFVDFWFKEGNPSAVGMINHWYEYGQKDRTEEVKVEFERIIREEFEDGKKLDMWFDVTVGAKR